MFGEVFRFEIRCRLRQPAFYVLAVVFFLLAFGLVSTDITRSGDAGRVAINGPYTIIRLMATFAVIGSAAVAVFCTTAVTRDHYRGTRELLYATQLNSSGYVLGRFAASSVLALLSILAVVPATIICCMMPWQDPDYVVSFRSLPYILGLLAFLVPSMFAVSSIVFSVATISRRGLLGYVALVVLICMWVLAKVFVGDLERQSAVTLIDPFGIAPFKVATRYWTVAERNSKLIIPTGQLLANRLVWSLFGAAMLGFTLSRVRLTLEDRRKRRVRRATAEPALPPKREVPGSSFVPTAPFTITAVCVIWWRQATAEIRAVMQTVSFGIVLLLGITFLVGRLLTSDSGTVTYPLTALMVEAIKGSFYLFLLIITVVFTAELVGRERRARVREMFDALPVSNWVPVTAKLAAIVSTLFITLAVGMVTAITFQVARGYYHFEFGLYFKSLFLDFLPMWMQLAALSMFVQVFTDKRYLGFLVMLAYLLAVENLPLLGFDHHLYLYGTTPTAIYSDMNGYGRFVAPLLWFNVYWLLVAALLVMATCRMWSRGTEDSWRRRGRRVIREANRNHAAAMAMCCAAIVLVGSWIFHNTNIRNTYRPQRSGGRMQATYEARYKQYEGLPQPMITALSLHVDLAQTRRRADLQGTLTVVNKTGQVIDTLHLSLDRDAEIKQLNLAGAELEIDDPQALYRVYRLKPPMAPNDSRQLNFELSVVARGFVNHDPNLQIVDNGTFFSDGYYLAAIGYHPERELGDPDERKRYGLVQRSGMPPIGNLKARQIGRNRDADRITFEATISTGLDQTAIAPGYLRHHWVADGRRHFHYVMDRPIFMSYAIVSGRYEVARDSWNDVAIEIYYHKPHGYNVKRMIEAVKDSLDYYTANFSPYQHRVVRIVEFPRYRRFAQSFPTTIPFSESAHFVDDLRDPKHLDMTYYITAHEVAHQWWGHQVRAAAVQGATMLVESLAEYSALMVMEKSYGREQMRTYLAYELDGYLSGRGRERIGERPLNVVESQRYIHYNKGSLAFYALRDYIGEQQLNAVLRDFIEAFAFRGPPYPTTEDLLNRIRAATPQTYQYLVKDFFEKIILYDNRVIEVTSEALPGGDYRVRIDCTSRKLQSDDKGRETELNHSDWIEVGVFANDQDGFEPLYLEKHQLVSGRQTIEVIVNRQPVSAGIDPRNLLIDRAPLDNRRSVSIR